MSDDWLEDLCDATGRLRAALLQAGGSPPLKIIVDAKTATILKARGHPGDNVVNFAAQREPTYVISSYGIAFHVERPPEAFEPIAVIADPDAVYFAAKNKGTVRLQIAGPTHILCDAVIRQTDGSWASVAEMRAAEDHVPF